MHDLVIAGGGPAGLAAAIRARSVGFDVVVLDRRRPPIDKACGEGVMPDGVARLRELGIEMPDVDNSPFRGIRYIDGEVEADGYFPSEPGLGIRRVHLHRALVERAESVGVDFRWGTKITGLGLDRFETTVGAIEGRYLVGADGRHSMVRRWAGLAAAPVRRGRFGIRRHFAIEPWSDLVEVHWGDNCEAYVTPVGPDEIGVALLWPGHRSSFDRLLAEFPRLAERLDGVPIASRDRGAGPLEQRCSAVVRGRLALLGDASGALDAITGEGLTLALHQAFALVEALEAGDLDLYARAHRRLKREPAMITALTLFAERRPWARRRMVRALAGDPALFSRFLEILVSGSGLTTLGPDGLFRLVRRLVAP